MEAAKPWYRWRGALLVTALVVANVVCLTSAGVASLAWPELLTPALLAWTFGLRHAVDADHIASIDNVTRNLLAKGIRSVAVGFWFSMGHSTIVFIVCCIVAFTSTAFAGSSIVARIGGVIGTCISAAFLYFIGILNLVVLGDVLWRHWHPEAATPAVDNASATLEEADAGGDHANLHFDFVKSEGSSSFDSDDSGDENGQEVEIEGAGAGSGDAPIAGPTGVLSRCCPRLLNMVDAPWKMYFVGVLFGLGFDTSTEIALLAITATTTAGSGENKEGSVPPLLTLILPLTFASAMSLLDTLDGILMTSMYGWAETNPRKKLLFNVFLTGTSSLVAIGIGTIETLQVLSSQFHWEGSFWLWINELPSSEIGWGVIGLFISSFLIALIVYTTMFGCKGG